MKELGKVEKRILKILLYLQISNEDFFEYRGGKRYKSGNILERRIYRGRRSGLNITTFFQVPNDIIDLKEVLHLYKRSYRLTNSWNRAIRNLVKKEYLQSVFLIEQSSRKMLKPDNYIISDENKGSDRYIRFVRLIKDIF